jgi:hypothetical protein
LGALLKQRLYGCIMGFPEGGLRGRGAGASARRRVRVAGRAPG